MAPTSPSSFSSLSVVRFWSSRRQLRGPPDEDHVVAVDDLSFVFGAELPGQPAGGPPHQVGDLGRVVVDQPAGDYEPVVIADVDRIAGGELALHPDHAGGQQGFAALDDRVDRAMVEGEPALPGGGVGQPQVPGGRPTP